MDNTVCWGADELPASHGKQNCRENVSALENLVD